MPILVPCACGKSLKAPDGSAGRKARCPNCGAVLTIPAPAPAEDEGYELAGGDDWMPPPPAPSVATATAPAPGTHTQPAKPASDLRNSQLYQAASMRVAQRDAAAARGPKPLFNALGVDVTWFKLTAILVVVAMAVALPVWFFKWGPGAEARLVSAQTVEAVPLLTGLATQEPYSLFTGQGNRALGIKGPKLKNQPVGVMASVDLAYSMGGGDGLTLVRPDPNGKHILVEADISHGIIEGLAGVSNYKLRIAEGGFTLGPADGSGPTTQPIMMLARFDEHVEIDIAGAQTTSYEPLLPAGVPPDAQKIEMRSGGPATGKLLYTGAKGIKGDFTFDSIYYMSGGAPGLAGLSATGHLDRTMPDGSNTEYIYRGGSLEMKWTKGSGRAGWWSTQVFEEHQGMNPYSKVRVALLCERPAGDAPQQLAFFGHPIATINPAKASSAAAKIAGPAAAPPPPEEPQDAPGFEEPVTTYLQLLADARDKARGVVGMSNMNQLGIAIGMYAEQNGGKLPTNLRDLEKVMPGTDAILVNPRTGEKPGFIYDPPAESFSKINDPAHTPILWEAKDGQKDPDGAILYADGHIEAAK